MFRSRWSRRLLSSTQSEFHRIQRRLSTPSKWPWKKIGVVSGGAILATIGMIESERRRVASLAESRIFRQGSPLHNIEGSLRTGDVLLFNRTIFEPTIASCHPLRMLLIMFQKLHGRTDYDHIGIIIVQNDSPKLLERGPSGRITLRPFDQRLLHSSANEIVLRRLNAPEMREEEQQRIDTFIEHIMGTPLTVTPTERLVSKGPSIPTFTLLRHVMASYFFSSFGTTSLARSSSIATLGHILETSTQLRLLDERMERMAITADPETLKGFSTITGSTTPFQRLQVKRREVQNRLDGLIRQYHATPDSTPFLSSSSSNSTSRAAELHSVSDFPSAVLVVHTLQLLGVLPDSRRGSLRLTSELMVPQEKIPTATAYPTRQFLSTSSLPLTYQPYDKTPTPSTSTSTPPPDVDCFFDREMFLKSKNRSLPYIIEEY